MKRIIVFLGILLSPLALAQSLGVRTVETKQEEVKLPAYDTTALFFDFKNLIKNPHFYDNQKILFLPYINSSDRPYTHYSGFVLKEEVELHSYRDTVWVRRRKNVREGDFYVNIPKSNVYHAEHIDNGAVRNLDTYVELTFDSGYFTPIQFIEGKEFTIKSCSCIDRSSGPDYISLEMVDESGVSVCFNHDHLGSETVPIMMCAFIDMYKSKYVGKDYHTQGEFVDNCLYAGRVFGTEKYIVLDTDLTCQELTLIKNPKTDTWARKSLGDVYYDLTRPILGLFFKDTKGREIYFEIDGEKVYYDYDYGAYKSDMIDGEVLDSSKSYKKCKLKHLMPAERYYAILDARRAKQEREEAEALRLEQERIDAYVKAEAKRKANEAKRKEEAEKARIEREQRIRAQYDKRYADLILAGKVCIGMTSTMCREAWGYPSDINRTTGSWGVHEQWVYGYRYLYFENGILTTIQD